MPWAKDDVLLLEGSSLVQCSARHPQRDHVGTDESGQRGEHLAELMCRHDDRLVKVGQHELLGRLVDKEHQSRHIENGHVPNSSRTAPSSADVSMRTRILGFRERARMIHSAFAWRRTSSLSQREHWGWVSTGGRSGASGLDGTARPQARAEFRSGHEPRQRTCRPRRRSAPGRGSRRDAQPWQ
jgi:hypothetical protein